MYPGGEVVRLHDGPRRLVDLLARPGQRVVEQIGRADQPGAVGRQAEDAAIVDPLAFEDGRAVVERVREDVQAALAPWNQLAIQPDHTVPVIHGKGHCDILSRLIPNRSLRASTEQLLVLIGQYY
jgi:hypothetical protein